VAADLGRSARPDVQERIHERESYWFREMASAVGARLGEWEECGAGVSSDDGSNGQNKSWLERMK